MAFDGLERINASEKDERAKEFTLGKTQSPFEDGAIFTLKGYDFARAKIDGTTMVNGKQRDSKAVFIVENNGVESEISWNALSRAKCDKDDKIKRPNGTFNKLCAETYRSNPNKSDGEILQAIINSVGTKKIKVRREDFVAKGKYGEYPTCLIHFELD